jgi:hypothetical protein
MSRTSALGLALLLLSGSITSCALRHRTMPLNGAQALWLPCERVNERFSLNNTLCGLDIDSSAAVLCAIADLKPVPRVSMFGTSVRFSLRDSSTLVVEGRVPRNDSSELGDGTYQRSCHLPLKALSRGWRLRSPSSALALFRDGLARLQQSSVDGFRECIVESVGSAFDGSTIYALRRTPGRSQMFSASIARATHDSAFSYVTFSLRPWDDTAVALEANQRFVPCSGAIAEVGKGS